VVVVVMVVAVVVVVVVGVVAAARQVVEASSSGVVSVVVVVLVEVEVTVGVTRVVLTYGGCSTGNKSKRQNIWIHDQLKTYTESIYALVNDVEVGDNTFFITTCAWLKKAIPKYLFIIWER